MVGWEKKDRSKCFAPGAGCSCNVFGAWWSSWSRVWEGELWERGSVMGTGIPFFVLLSMLRAPATGSRWKGWSKVLLNCPCANLSLLCSVSGAELDERNDLRRVRDFHMLWFMASDQIWLPPCLACLGERLFPETAPSLCVQALPCAGQRDPPSLCATSSSHTCCCPDAVGGRGGSCWF